MAINFFAVILALYPFAPPFAALRFTSLSTTVFSISLLFFIFDTLSGSVLLFCNSFLCLSPIRVVPFLSPPPAPFLPPPLLCLFLPASFLYTFLPLFCTYLLIFSLNSIPCQRKNPRDFFGLALLSPRRSLPLSKSSRDTSLAKTFSAPVSHPPSFSCVSLFIPLHVPPSRNLILSDDSSLAVGTVSGDVSHKSLNNFNVASSFPLSFFFSEFNRPRRHRPASSNDLHTGY